MTISILFDRHRHDTEHIIRRGGDKCKAISKLPFSLQSELSCPVFFTAGYVIFGLLRDLVECP